jgi:phosphoglycolate phosphatase-like HAD superfamily hydrolase
VLVLFDIDGTLLRTDGAGTRAMAEAGRRLVGAHFDLEGVEIAGRLDSLIWADAIRRHTVERPGWSGPPVTEEQFRAEYAVILAARLGNAEVSRVLPGVADLLERLAAAGVPLGLVTGNYPETGRLKIEASGLDPDSFVGAAWGSDGATRRDLPPIAIQRCSARAKRRVAASDVVVIGDTPYDIDCAQFNGCRSLAVATGPSHTLEDLLAHRPDHAVPDLVDTDAILEWMERRVSA